jgi:hypothetical protein
VQSNPSTTTTQVIAPYLQHYEGDIDKHVDDLRKHSKRQMKKVGSEGIRHLRVRSTGLLRSAQQAVVSGMVDQAIDEVTSGFTASESKARDEDPDMPVASKKRS